MEVFAAAGENVLVSLTLNNHAQVRVLFAHDDM
jgi:hypothetical protein